MATNAEGTNNEAVATGLVAGYVRTAGVGDDAHLSEDAQKRAIQRRAEEHGVKVEWYVDSGISGMVLDRPALQRLLVDAESGTSGLIRVFVHSPSRLSRKMVDLQTILVRLEAAGVELVYVNQSG